MTSDHSVFKRLSRQQLIVRRRSVGCQVLIFASPVEPLRCRRCGRHFNAVWKAFLCHICGLWTCQPCSSVIERERDMYKIRYVRACVACMSIVNKWPDPSLLVDASSQWVVQSSKSQLALNLADTLRGATKCRRDAVLTLLKHFRRLVTPSAAMDDGHHQHQQQQYALMLDSINEKDWSSTSSHIDETHSSSNMLIVNLETPSDGSDNNTSEEDQAQKAALQQQQVEKRELAQRLVQQCFEVSIPELPLHRCVFAEADGMREYPVFYDEETESPLAAPVVATEQERAKYLQQYDLTTRDVNTDEMALICDLAARELDASSAFISIIQDDHQRSVACRPQSTVGSCGVFTKRSQTFCAFALAARDKRPFLVRDAVLDFRFRNLQGVLGDDNLRFYCGFPIMSGSDGDEDDGAGGGVHIASLCVIDTNPRKHVTTMQYSILKRLAEMISEIWKEELGVIV